MANLLSTSSTDPFTLVYCSLWDMLENHQGLVDLVRPPNRIKWLGQNRDPIKDAATNTDKPEVRIDPGTPFMEPHRDSGTTKMLTRWDVMVSTGAKQLDDALQSIFPVSWELLRAMIGWRQNILDLRYNAARFVFDVKPGSWVVRLNDGELNRNVTGWSAGWTYEIYLQVSTLANMPTPVG